MALYWKDNHGDEECPVCGTRVSDVYISSPHTDYTNALWCCPICGTALTDEGRLIKKKIAEIIKSLDKTENI